MCQYKMPGTFTVKAGFNMPTSQSSPPGSGSLQPVSLEDLSSRESREFSEHHRPPPRIITAQSLDSARLSKILAGSSHSASQRNSRTLPGLANNLFGGRQLGEEAGAEDNNHKMWMIVLTVSAGLVVISVMAVLVVCRPASSQQDEELAEMSPASSQVNVSQVSHADTEALQPKKKEKKVYRPSESRA